MHTPLFEGYIFGQYMSITPWELIGFVGVFMFGSRWAVQMYYSHKAGKPVTPRLFWVLSMVGSLITLTYFIFGRHDKVGFFGNLFPSFIAGYNLYLDLTHRRKAMAAAETTTKGQVPAPQLTPMASTEAGGGQ